LPDDPTRPWRSTQPSTDRDRLLQTAYEEGAIAFFNGEPKRLPIWLLHEGGSNPYVQHLYQLPDEEILELSSPSWDNCLIKSQIREWERGWTEARTFDLLAKIREKKKESKGG
jgi:hypothetical protein